MTEVSIESISRGDKQIVSTKDTEKGTTFSFENIMPGKYKGIYSVSMSVSIGNLYLHTRLFL